jgi:tetratricopeptide (TPR) repeat protein
MSAISIPIFLLIIALSPVPNSASESNSDLGEGLRLYRQNLLEEAIPLLEEAVEGSPQNADAYAWLAETYRRLKQMDDAVTTARHAIEIDSCHSFAHTVLGDAFNPMYSSWELADFDSTWNHLLKAVDCDTADGNAWLSIWSESIRRGEEDLEQRALHSIMKSGFLTPAVCAYNRWMLRHLPENSLLLTNGDMDTYPAVALQEVEGFHTDVAVVNRSLLNTTWYARFVRDRYGISLPFNDSELDSLGPYRDEDGNLLTLSTQIFRGWLDLARSGHFIRPIAVSVTVHESAVSDIKDHLKLMGPFWLWSAEPIEKTLDMTMAEEVLAQTTPQDFSGPFVSPEDRSPVRRKYSSGIVRNVTSFAVRYTDALIESGRAREALEVLKWAEEFENQTELGPYFTEEIEELRKAAGE